MNNTAADTYEGNAGDPADDPSKEKGGRWEVGLQLACHYITTHFGRIAGKLGSRMLFLIVVLVTVKVVRQLGVLALPQLHKEHG